MNDGRAARSGIGEGLDLRFRMVAVRGVSN
jgi:hypothetical protein